MHLAQIVIYGWNYNHKYIIDILYKCMHGEERVLKERWGWVFYQYEFLLSRASATKLTFARNMTYQLRFPPDFDPPFTLSRLFLPTVCISCPRMSNLYVILCLKLHLYISCCSHKPAHTYINRLIRLIPYT